MDMDHDHDHDHGDMNMTMDMDMMKMYFHTSFGQDVILFKQWKPSNAGEMFGACVAVFILTIVYEALKYCREYLQALQRKQRKDGYFGIMFTFLHWTQAAAHIVQYALSYALMLVAMTFQVYLYLAVVIGAGVGYLILEPFAASFRSLNRDYSDPCC